MVEQVEKEIVELHDFFQEWFHGQLPNTDEAFARFSGVMADELTFVSTGGQIVALTDLNAGIKANHGVWTGKSGKIWIRNPQIRARGRGWASATYEEWQEVEGTVRARVSTVLFRTAPNRPNDIEWVHVHETWMPDRQEPPVEND